MQNKMEVIADNGQGDNRSILERDVKGNLYLTTNAETRSLVSPAAYSGTGWDDLDDQKWVGELSEQFGSCKAAELFVNAARGCEVFPQD